MTLWWRPGLEGGGGERRSKYGGGLVIVTWPDSIKDVF